MFGIRDITAKVWSNIRNFIAESVNSIIEQINNVIAGLNAINPFGDIPDVKEMSTAIMELGKNVKDTVVEFVGLKKVTGEVVENRDRFGAQAPVWSAPSVTLPDVSLPSVGGQEGAGTGFGGVGGGGGGGAKAGLIQESLRFRSGLNFLMTMQSQFSGAQADGSIGVGGSFPSERIIRERFAAINRMDRDLWDDEDADENAEFMYPG
jgi:hypothetical protein